MIKQRIKFDVEVRLEDEADNDLVEARLRKILTDPKGSYGWAGFVVNSVHVSEQPKTEKIAGYDSPEEVAWRDEYMKRKSTHSLHADAVDRMIPVLTAQETVDWLRFRGNVSKDEATPGRNGFCSLESNFREQYKWHRLQGRLDKVPWLSVLAQLMGLRQSVKALEPPKYDAEETARRLLADFIGISRKGIRNRE